MASDILVVDDEKDIRDLICDVLEDEGYSTRSAANSIDAFKLIDKKVPTVVILDIWLQGSELDGLGILEILKKKYPYLAVIMISGHGNVETAVTSIKLGAYDYIEKPFTEDKLVVLVKRACEVNKLLRENAELRQKVGGEKLVGSSSSIKKLKLLIDKVASSTGRILITGPSGSGKKLVAGSIHSKSKRCNEAFVVFDATGLSAEQADIKLFGDKEAKGINDLPRKMGLVELANLGTLYIEEVSELPLSTQNKLLNFLQNNATLRAREASRTPLDIRVIASTSKNLLNAVKNGTFREDLYYRLNVVPVDVVPLNERREDIADLCTHFLQFFYETSGFSKLEISEDAMTALQNYSWPGNIRQLRNVIEWLLIMHSDSNRITAYMLPPEVSSMVDFIDKPDNNNELMCMSLRNAREVFEKQYLVAQVNRFNGNISRMAKVVGMERSALHRKLKSLGISSNDNNPCAKSSNI
jgi:two-component system, NtrC family, nitrogen regulation response regulator NtrX